MNVYKKLQIARLALQEKKLTKSGKNKFAGYEYFELQDFLPTVQTIFADTGLCSVFRCGSSDATLTVYNTDNPEEYVLFTAPMAAAELKGCHPVQNLGASISYLRRYLYVNALEIVEHDALDATTGSTEPPRYAPKPVPKAVQPAPQAKPVAEEPTKDWQIKLTGSPDSENWKELVTNATTILLGIAKSEEDVMTIYRRNKQVFEQLKGADPDHFKVLMDKFSDFRNKFKEAA
jgi:hypothetical protein